MDKNLDKNIETSFDQTSSSPQTYISSSPPPPISRIGLNEHKAGMEGLDKAKINQIILEASKGSKYYEKEQEKEKKTKEKIDAMLKEVSNLSSSEKESAKMSADHEIDTIFESNRDLSRIIVHIDMDAFYAAVEMKDDPSLREVPMAVGGQSMLSTSNYAARRYGVRAAMPGFIAKKLCPQLIIVKSHFDKYQSVSCQVREILSHYDPLFSPMGLDEAYLDLTEYIDELMKCKENENNVEHDVVIDDTMNASLDFEMEITSNEDIKHSPCYSSSSIPLSSSIPFSSIPLSSSIPSSSIPSFSSSPSSLPSSYWSCALTVVNEIRQKIYERTQLTASAGIAVNKMLAKIGSDINKPNGQFLVPPTRDEIIQFIRELPIRKINGIGKVTEKMLNGLNIEMCGDLYRQRGILRLLFSKCSYDYFMNICLGIGSSNVHSEWERKSISTERTFPDISKVSEMYKKCHQLCHSLAEEVTEKNIKGRTVTLKLKTSHFEVKQRSMTFPKTTVSSFKDIHTAARKLLETEMNANEGLTLRLMGVRLSGLESNSPAKKRPTSTTTLNQFFTPSTPIKEEMEENLEEDVKKEEEEEKEEDEKDRAKRCKVEEESEEIDDSSLEVHHSICPICNTTLIITDNSTLNQHIDECLNHSTIKEITNTSSHLIQPISSITSTSPLPIATKSRRTASVTPQNKKRKGKRKVVDRKNLNTSLDSFFNK